MVGLDDESNVAVDRPSPLTSPVSRQRVPFTRRHPQISQTLGLLEQRDAGLESVPALIPKRATARLVGRAGSLQLAVKPVDLDVDPRATQDYNPRGYSSGMDS